MSADVGGRQFSIIFVGHAIPAHTVYTIKVVNTEGTTWTIQKRYREIRELHNHLRAKHPKEALPPIPGKRLFCNQTPSFIQSRMTGLQNYFDAVLTLEPVPRTPALVQFLGGPQEFGDLSDPGRHQQILDNLQNMLLNLSIPPTPLDETDISQRLKRYGQAMQISVLNQPVDPMYLRAPIFDKHPIPSCTSNSTHLDALKLPTTNDDAQLLSDLMNKLTPLTDPQRVMADPEKLIVPFPPLSI